MIIVWCQISSPINENSPFINMAEAEYFFIKRIYWTPVTSMLAGGE